MTIVFLSVIFFGLLTPCTTNAQVNKLILGTWSNKTGDMTLIIKEDKIADTEYFGRFKYLVKADSITIYYDTPLKYKLTVANKDTLILQSINEKRKYFRVK